MPSRSLSGSLPAFGRAELSLPSQIHRHRVEQRGEVLFRFPDLQTGSRYHHRQLRETVQNRVVNILSISYRRSVGLPERCFDGVAAYHVDGDSSADRLSNNPTNDLTDM